MKDAPAFDFYPERWLVGTASMSDAEQLAYLRLLCHQWTMDGLPTDMAILKRLAGKGLTETVLSKFPESEGSRRNPRLETVRQDQRKRIAKSREKIEKMVAARAVSRTATSATTSRTTKPNLSSNLTASSPLTTHHILLEKEPKGDVSVSVERSSKKERTAAEQTAANAVALGICASPALRQAWEKLKAYRTERGSSPFVGEKMTIWTQAASEALARKLEAIAEQHGDAIAIQCAETAIARRWLDIFPPDQRKAQTTKTQHGSATNPDEYA